jgi:hypothetical protein
MKISELKQYIKEIILAELTVTSDPNVARELTGKKIGYQFDPNAPKITQEDKGNLTEMAKITGNLKTAIEAVIKNKSKLAKSDLRQAIKSNSDVKTALGGESLFDNQLNQFIDLVKGERELSQRGRKPNLNIATKKSEEDKKGERLGRKTKPEDEDIEIEDTYGRPDPEDTSDDDKEPSQADLKKGEKTVKGSATHAGKLTAAQEEKYKTLKTGITKKVDKLSKMTPSERKKSSDLDILKQIINRKEVKDLFKIKGTDLMALVSDVIK